MNTKRSWALAALITIIAACPLALAANYNNDNNNPNYIPLGHENWAEHRIDDAGITTRLKMRLANDDMLKASSIDVDVHNGNVKLKGAVNTQGQVDRAIELARQDNDVVNVSSELAVTNAANVPPANNWGAQSSRALDDVGKTAHIKADLMREGLYGKGNQIQVKTLNDVVILNGHVKNWAQYSKVSQIAKNTDGVTKVINRIRVKS